MNILHVISNIDPASGGVAAAATGLAKAQRAAGINASLMSTYPADRTAAAADDLRKTGMHVSIVGPCPGRINRHPLIRPTLEAAMQGIDVVHIHGLWEEVLHVAATMARRRKIPYVLSPHGMLDSYSMNRSRWIKRFLLAVRVRRNLNGARALHYTADAELELAAYMKLKPEPFVEPNGLDLAEFHQLPPRGAFRQRFGIDPHRPLILFLSRLHPKKGLDLLIPAFAKLIAGLPPEARPALVIGGPDTHGYRAAVEETVAQHNVQADTLFTGMLHGVERIQAYADSDLFVLPSYQENFGIVVAEAMAAGLAVVITDKVNIDRDVLAAGAGAVVPTAVEPLRAALQTWLADPDKRRVAGERGRAFAFDRFGWVAIAKRWRDHFEKFAGHEFGHQQSPLKTAPVTESLP